jgi:predicted ATPase/DNA-binding SARP family transcriptional activator
VKPRKVLALLAYLAVEPGRHSRDALADLLFPELGRDRARAGVRQCLSTLRRALGGDWVGSDADAVWLEPGEGLWVDAREVTARGATRPRERLEGLDRLFRGDFLAGFFVRDAAEFESWQRSVEEALRREHARILLDLASSHLRSSAPAEATECAQRLLAIDPLNEAGHRALMESYALLGRRSEALQQFERCRGLLEAEVGAQPDGQTEALRARIARGEIRPPGAGAEPDRRAPGHNLPPPPTVFVGRLAEVEAVVDTLARADVRLLTITGPGGTGKTRLALEAARMLLLRFPDGVFFVDLAPLREAAHVISTVASALGVRDTHGSAATSFDLVREFLADRFALLLLDNLEHLPGAGETITRLVAVCPRIKVLATSREPLRLTAEHEYLLRPLPVPEASARLEDLRENEAMRLFAERARASDHLFALDERNAAAVSRICIALDGLPLAIELAAGRTRFLPPEKLLSLLEQQGSRMLSGGARDAPERHQTLWRTMEWSHALLRDSERALFRRLAVFSGGFTLEAAEAVCRLDGTEGVLADLESLVAKNLVIRSAAAHEPWYGMLVTVHEFANAQLEESGEEGKARLRHAEHYRDLVARAEPELDRARGGDWSRILEREYSNIRAAVSWSLDHAVTIALRISGALQAFSGRRGHWRDDTEWIEQSLDRSRGMEGSEIDRLRAAAFGSLANNRLGPDAVAASRAAAEQSAALWRKVGDAQGLAFALLRLALATAYDADEPGPVLEILEESASIQQENGDLMGLAHTLFFVAYFTALEGDWDKARHIVERDRQIAQKAGDAVRFAGSASLLGLIDVEQGAYAAAQAHFERSLELYRPTEDHVGLSIVYAGLGATSLLQGDFRQARASYETALAEALDVEQYRGIAAKVCMAFISLEEGRPDSASASFRELVGILRSLESRWATHCICACCAGLAGAKSMAGRPSEAAHILGGMERVMHAPYTRLAWGWDFIVTPTVLRIEFDRISAKVSEMLGETASAQLAAGRTCPFDEVVELSLS